MTAKATTGASWLSWPSHEQRYLGTTALMYKCTQHGIPRSDPVPQTREGLEKQQEQIKAYKALVTSVKSAIGKGRSDESALDETSKLLKQNPEYYTIWNDRRKLLLSQLQRAQDEQSEHADRVSATTKIIATDLGFLVPLMQKYPKCYWLWNHRAWLLREASARLPIPAATEFWTRELALDGKMLQQDKRNFHGWGYRRQIIVELERLQTAHGISKLDASMAQSELAYTRKMIGQDLSNFSAWHARSNLILKLLDETEADAAARKAMLDEELDLIHEALIDPRDQSLWFYHQFLTNAFKPSHAADSIAPELSLSQRKHYLEVELEYVLDALEGAEEVKWVYLSLVQLARAYSTVTKSWHSLATRDQVGNWMRKLAELDPLRVNRWKDWSQDQALGA